MNALQWLAGGGLGAALAGLAMYLLARHYKAQRDSAILSARVAADLAEETRRRSDETRRAATELLVQSESVRHDQAARADAIVRGLKVEIERMRRLLRDQATPDSVADRLDEFGRVLVLPGATADIADSRGADSAVPDPTAAGPGPVRDGEG